MHLEYGFVFDLEQEKLFRENKEIALSANAKKLLALLCSQANSSVLNEQIQQHIWSEMKNSATLRTQIHRVRTHLGEDIIHNVNGVGYMVKTI